MAVAASPVVQLLDPTSLGGVPVLAGWTTTAGGVSDGPFSSLNLGLHVGDAASSVIENRRRVAEGLGFSLSDVVIADQMHGATVARAGAHDRGRGSRSIDRSLGVDALVTSVPDVVLMILVADCVPVLLVDPDGPQVAVAHAGWRGAAAGVLEATVAELVAGGAKPDRLHAVVGPSIAIDRFEVGDEVLVELGLDRLSQRVDAGASRAKVDLSGVCLDRLAAAGVRAAQIHQSNEVTGDGTPYFSARSATPTGRFAMVAVLKGQAA